MVRIHERRVVAEPVLRQQGGRLEVHVPGRRPVADRPDAEHGIERLEAAQQVALLRGRVDAAHALVQVPVMADLVARVAHGTGDVRPRLGDPARDEERRPQLDPVEHPQQPRNRDARAVALVGHDVEVVGRFGVVDEHHGLGIEVEAEQRRGPDPVGPAKTGRQGLHGAEPYLGREAAALPVRRHGGRAAGEHRGRRPGPPRQPVAHQGSRVPGRGARGVPAAWPAPGPRPDDRGAGRARARTPAGQDRPARAVHRPRRAPGPQRDAVLPAARRPPGGVPADRLHADGRAGDPGVQPHHPADPRHVDHPGRRGPHPGPPAPGPVRGRAAGRGDRQRADPGPGRPGRRRHGHPDRQARAVHGGLRHPPDR